MSSGSHQSGQIAQEDSCSCSVCGRNGPLIYRQPPFLLFPPIAFLASCTEFQRVIAVARTPKDYLDGWIHSMLAWRRGVVVCSRCWCTAILMSVLFYVLVFGLLWAFFGQ